MNALLRTLSLSYIRRHPGKTMLAVVGVAVGVATFVAIRQAQVTLAAGLRTTVDRLAGAADLEVTGAGGVPEAMLERLEDLPGVEAAQPMIEQIVHADDARVGTLLVVGVDLVGDRKVRAYEFSGDDADVDDPLVFLAQPDSIALNVALAARAGVRKGDAIAVRTGATAHRMTVRALLDAGGFGGAFGGKLAVTDVYAAEDLFGRGRRFDWIDIRLRAGTDKTSAAESIRRAIGPGYQVEPPDARGADLQRAASAIVSGFDIVTLVALGLGVFLIFNVCAIGVERRRRDIGILRSIGATPAQVMRLFLVEAALVGAMGGAAGAVLGMPAAGYPQALMGTLLHAVQGLGDGSSSVPRLSLVLEGTLAGVFAAIAGAWIPARRAACVRPIDAISNGVYAATTEPLSGRVALVGAALFGAVSVAGYAGWMPARLLLPVVVAGAAIATIALSGHIARGLAIPIARLATRVSPAAGRLASHALLGRPRRTAASAAVIALSAGFVLGAAGYLGAVSAEADRWTGSTTIPDLTVRASSGFGPSDAHLPYDVRAAVSSIPGVAATRVSRTERVDFRGRSITLVALERGAASADAYPFVAGDHDAFTRALPAGTSCVVTDLFARRFGTRVGDTVTVISPGGDVPLSVAAIVAGYRGAVIVDRAIFTSRWSDDRIDSLDVTLEPGVDRSAMRDQIEARIGATTAALVLTREELTRAHNSALGALEAGIRSTVLVALIVTCLGIAASLLVSVAERSRDVGIARAIGATPAQLIGAMALEALALATIGVVMAVPLGELFAWFLRVRVSDAVANVRFAHVYPVSALATLAAGLPIVALVATWAPIRWALALAPVDAISYE